MRFECNLYVLSDVYITCTTVIFLQKMSRCVISQESRAALTFRYWQGAAASQTLKSQNF
jgi:hypothetical protein